MLRSFKHRLAAAALLGTTALLLSLPLTLSSTPAVINSASTVTKPTRNALETQGIQP